MSVLAAIFDGVGGKIVESLDGLFTSDDERLAKENELQAILQKGKKQVSDAVAKHQTELTRRMELDMQSDSWLSKNVRPMSLVFLLIVYTVLALTDGNLIWGKHSFDIGKEYVSGYQNFLMMVFAFYFGGRSYEKATKIKAINKKSKKNVQTKDDSEWNDDDWGD